MQVLIDSYSSYNHYPPEICRGRVCDCSNHQTRYAYSYGHYKTYRCPEESLSNVDALTHMLETVAAAVFSQYLLSASLMLSHSHDIFGHTHTGIRIKESHSIGSGMSQCPRGPSGSGRSGNNRQPRSTRSSTNQQGQRASRSGNDLSAAQASNNQGGNQGGDGDDEDDDDNNHRRRLRSSHETLDENDDELDQEHVQEFFNFVRPVTNLLQEAGRSNDYSPGLLRALVEAIQPAVDQLRNGNVPSITEEGFDGYDDDMQSGSDHSDDDDNFYDYEGVDIVGVQDEDYDEDEDEDFMDDENEDDYDEDEGRGRDTEFYDDSRFHTHRTIYSRALDSLDYPSNWNYSRDLGDNSAYLPECELVHKEPLPNPNVTNRLYKGEFGPHKQLRLRNADRFLAPVSVTDSLLNRQLGGTQNKHYDHVDLTMRHLPNNPGKHLFQYNDTSSYGGRFTNDGKYYYMYRKDFTMSIYDTSDVYRPKLVKNFEQDFLRNHNWTITDACLSNDYSMMINCSLTPYVTVTKFFPARKNGYRDFIYFDLITIDLNDEGSEPGTYGFARGAVFSLALSHDSTKLLIGGSNVSGSVAICDMTRPNDVKWLVKQHRDDVNSVKFLDEKEQVIVTGSDEGVVRLWDLRTSSRSSISQFVGHTEGITSIDINSIGNHIISNSKDQTLKLWDIRSPSQASDAAITRRVMTSYHYQSGDYPGPTVPRHPRDGSLMTYRGHEVSYTAIKCGFSPLNQTGEKYIYSGSANGQVVIWKLDGQIVRILGGNEAYLSGDTAHDPRYHLDQSNVPPNNSRYSIEVVREAAWHPDSPTIYAATFGGLPMEGIASGHLIAYHANDPLGSVSKTKHYEVDYDNYRPQKDIQALNDYYSQ